MRNEKPLPSLYTFERKGLERMNRIVPSPNGVDGVFSTEWCLLNCKKVKTRPELMDALALA